MRDPLHSLEAGLRYERRGAVRVALDRYRSAADSAEPRTRSEALRRVADAERLLCRWGEALAAARQSAAVAREAGLPDLLAEALNAEGVVHQSRGDLLAAASLFEAVLVVTDDARMRGVAMQNLGAVALARGELEEAERRFQASYAAFDEAAYLRGTAISLLNAVALAMERNDPARATELCIRALEAARSVEDGELIGLALLNQGEILLHLGDAARAAELAERSLDRFARAGNGWRRIASLRLLGDARRRQGMREPALRCFRRALDLAQRIGALHEAAGLVDRVAELEG